MDSKRIRTGWGLYGTFIGLAALAFFLAACVAHL
jgi:hypothetical protein